MALINQSFPGATPILDEGTSRLSDIWFRFFLSLYNRTGGGTGNNSNSFNYPITNGAIGQVLTSEGPANPSIWTTPVVIRKTSDLINDSGFITSDSLDGFASSNNPLFTGTPQAPTAPVNTRTKQIATTEFVINQGGSLIPKAVQTVGSAGTSFQFSKQDHVHPRDTNIISNGGATFTSGTGAPTSNQPVGSLYSRTNGGSGARIYVSAGSSTWNPIPGV